jgi:DNA-binding transcriptional MerR regulator
LSNNASIVSKARTKAGYSIRITARLTSLPPDTLRVWERRYGFPTPERTPGGSRLYSAEEVETLSLLARAIKAGFRPSEVVGKPRPEIERLLALSRPRAPAPQPPSSSSPTIESLLDALAKDDVATLQTELRQAAILLGPRRFLVDLAQPLSVRVGEAWAKGELEVRHEHVLSSCLSTQLRVLSSGFEERPDRPLVVLTTLPGEAHGLGLEMIALYLAIQQVTPRLVGTDTPPDQIVKAVKSHRAAALGIAVARPNEIAKVTKQLRAIAAELPRRVRIWVGGAAAESLDLEGDAFRIVSTWADLDTAIGSLPRLPL